MHHDYVEKIIVKPLYTAILGDSAQRLKEIESNSIHVSVYSPPFADLYTYSASEFDLGNSRNSDEFLAHYKFIIQELLRVTMPGRITCVHTADIPAMSQKDGYIGMRDFPGAVIKAYEENGWIYHGYAVVAKNPQEQAIRTHSKGLLFVQFKKDSASSRPAILDRVLFFRKDGDNPIPITPPSNGEAILLISSELSEVVGLAQLVLVMRGGKIVAEFAGSQTETAAIMRTAAGV